MFTYKLNKPTGKHKKFFFPTHNIKIKKRIVGSIEEKDFEFIVRFQVYTTNENTDWKWITLKKRFHSLEDTKFFLFKNYYDITNHYNLYHSTY